MLCDGTAILPPKTFSNHLIVFPNFLLRCIGLWYEEKCRDEDFWDAMTKSDATRKKERVSMNFIDDLRNASNFIQWWNAPDLIDWRDKREDEKVMSMMMLNT